MGAIICHHKGRYNFYSTISEGFRFVSSLDINQLKWLIKEEEGSSGLAALPARLERAHENGNSGLSGGDLDELLCCNQAGKNESHLSTEECIEEFLS